MITSPLSPKARELLEHTRPGILPGPEARERIRVVLAARLAAGAPALGGVGLRPFLHPHLGRLAWGLVVAGGLTLYALRQAATPASTAPAIDGSPGAVAIAAPRVPEPPAAVAPPLASADDPAPQAPVRAARGRNRLGEEVALLSRATSALSDGRADDALTSLAEHQRQFPRGVLTVERHTMRAQALCSLQRINEGRAELAHLSAQSPAAAQAQQLCDAAASRQR